MLVWLDLETTGLDPRTGSILEIAMIATDDNFVQVGEPFVSIARPLHMRGAEVMDGFVRDMHRKNGLLKELYIIDLLLHGDAPTSCLRPGLPMLEDVETRAHAWLQNVTKGCYEPTAEAYAKFMRTVPLAGNTVHFDKRWLIEHMDEFEALFSHRIYDVSSFTEEVKRSAPEVYKRRPGLGPDGKPVPMHRALDDIKNSIATAKFYRSCARWSVDSHVEVP